MSGDVTQYAGRTVDVLAFHGAESGRERLLEQALVPVGGRSAVTAGIQKLAQRWLLEFLTEEASIPYLPGRGTVFMTEARQGLLRTTVDAEQSFVFAADQARINLVAEEESGIPTDEAYGGVTLVSLAVAGDRLTLNVRLTSRAGNSRQIILPLNVVPGG